MTMSRFLWGFSKFIFVPATSKKKRQRRPNFNPQHWILCHIDLYSFEFEFEFDLPLN